MSLEGQVNKAILFIGVESLVCERGQFIQHLKFRNPIFPLRSMVRLPKKLTKSWATAFKYCQCNMHQ